jgi:capsular polysaccharide biosynthesis protein
MSQPGDASSLKFLAVSQLQCRSIVTAAASNIRKISLTDWAEGISVFEVPDVIYLPKYGIQICYGFVPEEAINFSQHLDIRLGRDPARLSPDNTIIDLALIDRSPAEVCVLGHMFSHVFQHWLEELLKVVALEKFGFDGFYVFPDWFPPFCHDSLHLLGVPSTRIIMTNNPAFYKKAFLTTTIHHFIANRFPKLISHLRDLLYEGAANEVGAGHRIWVERGKNASGRDVINKEEVYSCINRYDFTTIDFGQYTFRQQIGIDREMRVMLGPHGSAFAHCSFMKACGQVVEIFSPFYINPSVIQLCQVMQHSYNQIVPLNQKFLPYQFGTDIMVDIDHLELVLSTLFRDQTEK